MSIVRIVLATVAVLVAASPLLAQTATLSGRVVDQQGAGIANAEATLLTPNNATRVGAARSAADGSFAIDGVAPGGYVLFVRAPGFSSYSLPVTVRAQPTMVTVPLTVAGVTEDVTVQGGMTGTVATGKTNLPVRDLPLTVHAVPSHVIQGGFVDLFPSLANQLVDGVRHEGNRINTQLVNIDRVEVLKGPSSALYGGGAIGATVNLIRKKPSPLTAYDFSAAAGSWKLGRGTFGASGRLGSDALSYRLDAGAETKQGYRHNDTTRLQITPSAAWRVGDNGQVNVYYTFSRDRFDGDAGIPLLDTDFGTPLPESTFPDVPRDRNYRTPFDFAESYDHNLQAAYARQLNQSWGFRNTLSYRPVNGSRSRSRASCASRTTRTPSTRRIT